MSKEIIRIIQNNEGGENPKTKLPEKPSSFMWRIPEAILLKWMI